MFTFEKGDLFGAGARGLRLFAPTFLLRLTAHDLPGQTYARRFKFRWKKIISPVLKTNNVITFN